MSAELASWAHANSSAKKVAKTRLAVLPESETGHGKAVPFPFADKAEYEDKLDGSDLNEAIEEAPKKQVPLEALHAIQHSVRANRVAGYIDNQDAVPRGARSPRWGGPVDLPIVVDLDGKLFLHDGHHRCTAAALLGEKSILARVVTVGKDAK